MKSHALQDTAAALVTAEQRRAAAAEEQAQLAEERLAAALERAQLAEVRRLAAAAALSSRPGGICSHCRSTCAAQRCDSADAGCLLGTRRFPSCAVGAYHMWSRLERDWQTRQQFRAPGMPIAELQGHYAASASCRCDWRSGAASKKSVPNWPRSGLCSTRACRRHPPSPPAASLTYRSAAMFRLIVFVFNLSGLLKLLLTSTHKFVKGAVNGAGG